MIYDIFIGCVQVECSGFYIFSNKSVKSKAENVIFACINNSKIVFFPFILVFSGKTQNEHEKASSFDRNRPDFPNGHSKRTETNRKGTVCKYLLNICLKLPLISRFSRMSERKINRSTLPIYSDDKQIAKMRDAR